MSKTLILKVLSGSQLGVEVGLPDGEYSFGSGPDSDIQFADLSMAAIHGQLRVAGGKVEIRATGAAIQTASGLVIAAGDGDWREIAQLDRITAGTSVFAVGGADANWTSLAASPAPVVERRSEPSKPLRLNRNWMIGSGVVAACVLGVLFLTGGGQSLPIAARSTPDQNLQLVQEALADLPFPHDLDILAEADGTITVAGYVETAIERRAVQNTLQDLGLDVRRRIWALEALRTDISGLIASQDIDISATLQPDGELVLSGVWLDRASLDHTVGLLESEVFGLSRITDDVVVAEDFLAQVNELIVRLQLNELVLARLDGMLIETTGVVPRDKMDNWVGFMRTYARQIAPYLPLRSFVTLEGEGGTASVPVIIGPAEIAEGRVLAPERVETDTSDPTSLFAQPDGAVPASETAPPATTTPSADEGTVPTNEYAEYEAMIDEFARQNPDTVSTLIRALTNGRLSDIDGLRAFFASGQGAAAGEAASPANPFAGSTVSDPDAIVRILNGEGLPMPEVVPEAEDVAEPVVAASTAFDGTAALARLNEAVRLLYDTSGDEPKLTPDALAQNPELAAVSKEMIELAGAQSEALARGENLLSPLAPLEAVRSSVELTGRCWDGAHITVENLPTVLLWMDILSISSNLDISQVRPDSRLLFMEAALNPERIRQCLRGIGNEYGGELLRNSDFLREMSRNDLFAAFLLRNVQPYPLDLAGVSLEGERYAQLIDGRKIGEGAAPAVDSRLMVIGDLGLLIRVSDGYRVNLYRDDIGWLISGL